MEFSKKQWLLKAQKYCAYQERCQKEMRAQLYKWVVPKDTADDIMIELIEEKYINEERFAIAFAGGKFRVKKWGRYKIVRALKHKGISEYCINKAMAELPDEDYQNHIIALIEKKAESLKTEKNNYIRKNKVAQFVINKGYESNLVWEQIQTYFDE